MEALKPEVQDGEEVGDGEDIAFFVEVYEHHEKVETEKEH